MKGFLELLFRRRGRRGVPYSQQAGGAGPQDAPQLYRIDFDMMLKGSLCKRRRVMVRQYGVTVNGSTRLVTSGDIVDRETYVALLNAGAIRPAASDGPADLSGAPIVVDHTSSETAEE